MTVKILLDPIMTAAPSRCSTFIQFVTFMERTLAQRNDVFFYCLLPDWDFSEEEMNWLPDHENIQYISIPQHKDRTKEYVTLRDELDAALGFNGRLWDFDVVITVRSGLASLFKMLMTSPRQNSLTYLKEVWVIEEMPLMTYKSSVLTLDPKVQDRFTLDGYLAADRVIVMSYHEKGMAVKAARDHYAPSLVRELMSKLKEAIPTQVEDFKLKEPDHFFKAGEGKAFTMAYVGRLMASTTNIDQIYSAMTNQWIMKGEKVRMLVCTNSTGGKKSVQPPEHMEKYYAPREEFWRMAREDMHVLMLMHEEAGFLLSMMEPVMLGTPVIVMDAPWSRGQLGPDYPFYVNSEMELYAVTKMFYDDYADTYSKFQKWFEEWFVPTYTKRCEEDLLYKVLDQYLVEYEETSHAKFSDDTSTRKDNSIVQMIIKDDPDDIRLFSKLQELADTGDLRSLQRQLDDDNRDVRGLIWSTPWNYLRMILKTFYGYEDASTEVGHLRKRKTQGSDNAS